MQLKASRSGWGTSFFCRLEAASLGLQNAFRHGAASLVTGVQTEGYMPDLCRHFAVQAETSWRGEGQILSRKNRQSQKPTGVQDICAQCSSAVPTFLTSEIGLNGLWPSRVRRADAKPAISPPSRNACLASLPSSPALTGASHVAAEVTLFTREAMTRRSVYVR